MFGGTLKYIIGWAVVFIFRLIPFRPPNVEPVMATLMPFSKKYGAIVGFAFAFLSIFLFDLVTSGIGMWTWITACAYGALGLWAYYYLRNKKGTAKDFVTFSIFGTLIYDAITGLSIGPLLFGQSFMEALIGQVPFTVWHLAGNIAFAAIISPAFYRWIVQSEKLELAFLKTKFAK